MKISKRILPQDGGLGLFYVDGVFAVIQYQECVPLVYILVFAETYFPDVAGDPDVDWRHILVYEGIVGDVILHVFPEMPAGPCQPCTYYGEEEQVRDKVSESSDGFLPPRLYGRNFCIVVFSHIAYSLPQALCSL